MWTVSILDEFFQVICDARVDVLALIQFDWTIFINPKGHDEDEIRFWEVFFVMMEKHKKEEEREKKSLHARRKAEKVGKRETHTQRYFPRA